LSGGFIFDTTYSEVWGLPAFCGQAQNSACHLRPGRRLKTVIDTPALPYYKNNILLLQNGKQLKSNKPGKNNRKKDIFLLPGRIFFIILCLYPFIKYCYLLQKRPYGCFIKCGDHSHGRVL
jgi:hypothetical protein